MELTVLPDRSEIVHYPNPALPVYIMPGTLSAFAGMAALCHWHEDVEFMLPVEGHLHYRVNGREIAIGEGCALFVNARQMHYGYSADGSDCRYLCFTFNPALLTPNEYLRTTYIHPLCDLSDISSFLLTPQDPAHRALIDTLRSTYALVQSDAPGAELRVLASLLQAWQQLYLLLQGQLGRANEVDSCLLAQKKMLLYIQQNYPERITLPQIAQAGEVCRSRCCQIFRRYMGRTPTGYLNSYRLEQAAALLRQTALPITEIASRCGFASASYFAELFTRQKGLPPTKFRQMQTAAAQRKAGGAAAVQSL